MMVISLLSFDGHLTMVAGSHHFKTYPDPDPVFYFNADPPDPAFFHLDADLDPGPYQSDGNLRPLV
jgi:hypothetical protein